MNSPRLGERLGKLRFKVLVSFDQTLNVTDHPPKPTFQKANFPIAALVLLGMPVASDFDQRTLADPDIGLSQLQPRLAGQNTKLHQGGVEQ